MADIIDLWKMLKHVTFKKYKKGYGSYMPFTEEMSEPYKEKVIILDSRKVINDYVDKHIIQSYNSSLLANNARISP